MQLEGHRETSGARHTVAIMVAATPAWTDIGIFASTTVGVFVTVAAVLVALVGPALQTRWRRPAISIDPADVFISASVNLASVVRLVLANAQGRDTARDVEVFIYVTQPGTTTEAVGGEFTPMRSNRIIVDQANLNFDDPTGNGAGRSTASVPSGFWREVNFAALVKLDQHDLDGRRAAGYFALYPPLLARRSYLWEATTYEVTITATGSNFDAVTYTARLVLSELAVSIGETERSEIRVRWENLRRSSAIKVQPTSPWSK